MSLPSGPSSHLSWKELACRDGTPYPKVFIDDGRVFKLATMFEAIRHLCGDKPIRVISAYRTPSHNRKIGGAKYSQHIQGRALDMYPPQGMEVGVFYNLIHRNASELGVHGLGRYENFVHADIRPVNKLVTWSGTGVKDSVATT